jgi:hypothetical protein
LSVVLCHGRCLRLPSSETDAYLASEYTESAPATSFCGQHKHSVR